MTTNGGECSVEWDRNAQSVWNPPYPVGFSFSGPIRCQNTFWNQWRTTRNGVWLFSPIPIFSPQLPENGHWEKMTQLIKMIQIWCLSIESSHTPQTVPRVTQTTPRHLPDSLQTSQNMAYFDQSEATWRKGSSHQFWFNSIYLCCHSVTKHIYWTTFKRLINLLIVLSHYNVI